MNSTTKMDIATKLDLITKNLQEVIGEDEIIKIISERDLKIYWGTAPTGKPHLGYFVPMWKIADFLKAGCKVIILFADLHAILDGKTTWELLDARCEWYEIVIKEILNLIGVPIKNLCFMKGSKFQLSAKYTLDMYKLASNITITHALKAGSEVVKQTKNPLLSRMLYPLLQSLDEEYLHVDAQFGGIDQRKIFMLAREKLSLIGYSKRCHLMNPLIPGLSKSGKMSASSSADSKIELDDTYQDIHRKIKKAYSVDGQVEGNGLLAIVQYIIFPWLEAKNKPFVCNRPDKWGGPLIFKTYTDVEQAFSNKELISGDLKIGITDMIVEILSKLQKRMGPSIHIRDKAYN